MFTQRLGRWLGKRWGFFFLFLFIFAPCFQGVELVTPKRVNFPVSTNIQEKAQ